MQKIAISITPQYHTFLQYLDINIDICLGNGIIAQPCRNALAISHLSNAMATNVKMLTLTLRI